MKGTVQWLTELGIPTYRQAIKTAISNQTQLNIPLPKQLPKDIGRIIGLSVYCDTVDPENNPLITTTNAENLYLALKDGATEFFIPVRLDDLLFNFAGVPVLSGEKYYPVNIPGDFDLSTSYYINPTLITSPPDTSIMIQLNIHYINVHDYDTLIKKGFVLQRGLSQKDLGAEQ